MKPKVLIVGGDYQIARMFVSRGWEQTRAIEDADLVQFTGGADVSPELYGEENLASYNNPKRDETEKAVYEKCLALGKPMAGICRGNQLLSALTGGFVLQDITGHAIGGTHEMTELSSNRKIQTTSTHHQAAVPPADAEIIAVASLPNVKKLLPQCDKKKAMVPDYEVEVFYCERDVSPILGFQGHPEYGNRECENYFFELLDRYMGL